MGIVEIELRGLHLPWSVMIAALSWATSASWSATCCLEIESCLLSVDEVEIALRLGEQRWSLANWPCDWASAAW